MKILQQKALEIPMLFVFFMFFSQKRFAVLIIVHIEVNITSIIQLHFEYFSEKFTSVLLTPFQS